MLAPEITLEAALRDVDSEHLEYRLQAARSLAPAVMVELDEPAPRWRATEEHPRGAEVLAALLRLVDEGPPVLKGTAAVGLGTLGAAEAFDRTEDWLHRDGDDEDTAYLRECAVIVASLLGRAAIDADADGPLRERVESRVEAALQADAPEVRFQAAIAAVELWGPKAEPGLVAALRTETHEEVREGLVDALSHLDPPGPEACAALEEIVEGPDGVGSLGFQAAMALAAARRASARPRLVAALAVRHQRDDALEALAALGGGPPEDVERVYRLARRVMVPGITRVRAAYALARMAAPGPDNPGLAMLRRLRWHPRPAVREAVRDAFANLETLSADPA